MPEIRAQVMAARISVGGACDIACHMNRSCGSHLHVHLWPISFPFGRFVTFGHSEKLDGCQSTEQFLGDIEH